MGMLIFFCVLAVYAAGFASTMYYGGRLGMPDADTVCAAFIWPILAVLLPFVLVFQLGKKHHERKMNRGKSK